MTPKIREDCENVFANLPFTIQSPRCCSSSNSILQIINSAFTVCLFYHRTAEITIRRPFRDITCKLLQNVIQYIDTAQCGEDQHCIVRIRSDAVRSINMRYSYRISSINESDRWVLISSNDDDINDTDSFVFLIKTIASQAGAKVKEVGNFQYAFDGDPMKLTYQWDGLFGISVIYPSEVSKEQVRAYFESLSCFE